MPLPLPHRTCRASVVVLATLAAGCASTARTPPVPAPAPPALAPSLLVERPSAGGRAVVRVPLEEYVAGVVAAELSVRQLPPAAAAPMLELQAVLARTYAVANLGRHRRDGFDLCAETHCQLYRPERVTAVAAAVGAAVDATRALVVQFDAQPIVALYHADCGGRTSGGEAVWGGAPLPYLAGADDPSCLVPPRTWRFEASPHALAAALTGEPAFDVGGRLDAVDVLETDAAGRVVHVALEGPRSRLARGDALRRAVMARFGADSIRSPRFTVSRQGDRFVFEGQGVGHGVGLCQRGALARLAAGATVRAVLAHYYRGTTLSPWRPTSRLTEATPPALPLEPRTAPAAAEDLAR